jgi:hypothetical protein
MNVPATPTERQYIICLTGPWVKNPSDLFREDQASSDFPDIYFSKTLRIDSTTGYSSVLSERKLCFV